MFEERKLPWEDLGIGVTDCKSSEEAMRAAGLDWVVERRGIADPESGKLYPGYAANVRIVDDEPVVLGIVSERYQIIQNLDAFRFTNKLLGEGSTYITGGALFGGKKVYLVVKMNGFDLMGEEYDSYLIFTNSHDGMGSVRAAITPVRVICSNTLNLALNNASRSWSCNHIGELSEHLHEASKTLSLSEKYLSRFKKEMEGISGIDVDEEKVKKLSAYLLPINNDDGKRKIDHIKEMRNDILVRWKEAPDLSETPKNGYRFMNAISDFAIHTDIHRDTKTFRENLFGKVITGSGLYIDKAYDILVKSA